MKSKFCKGNQHGKRMREIITATATANRATKLVVMDPKVRAVERYLDDVALSRIAFLMDEGMRGFRA